MITNDSILTIPEAADLLKVHWQTVRSYLKRGLLPYSKVGKNVRLKKSDVEQMLSTKKTNRTLEIEIRFVTKNRQKIENKLISMGAKVTFHAHIIDHWFGPKFLKSMDHNDEWYSSGGGYGTRIREQDNSYRGVMTTTLEIKRLSEARNHNTCIEHELEVTSYETAADLLRLMEHKEFITIDKDRVVYAFKNFKVSIDEIKGFATAVEIETVTTQARDKVLTKLRAFAKEIGLDVKDEVEKSVTNMAMRQLAKF